MQQTKRLVPLIISISLILSAAVAPAQNLEEKARVHKLNNGLTVIFIERHGVPTFSALYGFKVGAVDEVTGITGVAHLFEHMAFKGTPRIGTLDYAKEKPLIDEINRLGRELSLELVKGEQADQQKIKTLKEQMAKLDQEEKKLIIKDEIDKVYSSAGGVGLNAGTGTDQTMYMISLPSNRFELFCLIESERMKNGVMREFYTERSVIQEERKQTTEAVPTRMLSEAFMSAAFMAHPYNHPVVGWASDINSVTLEEAQEFKSKYYTPNNCVVTLVGDVFPDKAIPLFEKYFGDIPKGNALPVMRTEEPKQLGERRVRYEAEAEPQMYLGFHKPNFPSRDDAVLSVISSLLTDGRSSILYKDLIKEKQLAMSINTSNAVPGARYPNLFIVMGAPRFPHTNEELEQAVSGHLERLKQEEVSEKDLQKVKNNLEANYIRAMRSNMGLAFTVLRYHLLYGDWKLLYKFKDMIHSVTPADIKECARKYFSAENRTVAYLIKKAK